MFIPMSLEKWLIGRMGRGMDAETHHYECSNVVMGFAYALPILHFVQFCSD